MILIIFPRIFGPSTSKELEDAKTKNRVYIALMDEGMLIYKRSITENNSKMLRDKIFSSDSVIWKIWPFIRKNLSETRLLPKGPKEALLRTYPEVAEDMRKWGLPMPDWWEKKVLKKF